MCKMWMIPIILISIMDGLITDLYLINMLIRRTRNRGRTTKSIFFTVFFSFWSQIVRIIWDHEAKNIAVLLCLLIGLGVDIVMLFTVGKMDQDHKEY